MVYVAMFATQVLPETPSDEDIQEDVSEVVGYLIVNDKKHEVKKGITKIGRDSSMCSIVIENFTISKVHAEIESEGIDDSFIYDVGSTNQTKLGKKVLKPHCRYKLDNESKLTLGNIIATFVLPKSLNSTIETTKLNSENINSLDEVGDIFELATQVTTPMTSTTKIPVFKKLPESSNVFKVPTLILPKESSVSVFDEVTQCRLDSQETRPKTVFQDSLCKNLNNFNLSTEDQLCESQALEIKCKGSDSGKNKEEDKIKSWLNDGQDDVLCVFMSLHSPKGHKNDELLKEIKTEVFEASTQTQPVIQESVGQVVDSSNKEDFSRKQSITNTTQSNLTENFHEEDIIKTQEFGDEKVVKTISQDEETQPYLNETIVELSINESKNSDEDLILTQAFETRDNTKTNIIPESEDINEIEDFMATQIYDFDREILGNEISNKAKTPPQQLSDACDLVESLNSTQRNNQDDYIETQVFATDFKNDKNISNNEEDFIATQIVEMPVNKTPKRVEESSRESTPDFLDFKNTRKDTEDFISTQLFDVPECQTSKLLEQPDFSCSNKTKDDYNQIINEPDKADSSGDETESDLEIILDKPKTRECSRKFYKTEPELPKPHNIETEESNSNSSYIFELPPENQIQEGNTDADQQQEQSDSDETDCEEIAIIAFRQSVKQEPLEKIEETQAMTTLPDKEVTNDVWMAGGLDLSPKFESGIENNPTSPEFSNAHPKTSNKSKEENENGVVEDGTPSKKKKIESGVDKSEKVIDSPLKRPLCSPDVVPIKKSKTEVCTRLSKTNEKKLSRLVQAHDIAQIQPTRTRNSVKTTIENKPNKTDSITNEHTSSRRKETVKKSKEKKINGDITSYLTAKKVETRRTSQRERVSPKVKKMEPISVESSDRILRSSRSRGNSTSSIMDESPIRKSKRISRTNGEYFTSSCVNVVFTGFYCESLENIISELGGKKEGDLSCGEVVIADKVRRTVKFLCAIGLGLPITSPEWLLSCKKAQKFLNPWNFILKDEESEEKYNFELKTSLEKAKKEKLFEGFSIFATKSTKPPVKELLAIVECCGGKPLLNPPEVWPKKTIIVSCLEDEKWWPLPKSRNIKVVHYEFILGGVLRQKIDFKTYRLR